MPKLFLYILLSTILSIATIAQTHFLVSGFPSPTTVGTQGNFTVTAKNSSNVTDITYTGTVHFTSSDGLAILPADYTFFIGDNGVKTFVATLNTVGVNMTITVTDIASPTFTGSQTSITVNAALPVELISFVTISNRFGTELTWATATETNNYGFEIQRSSLMQDGEILTEWSKIGFVSGAGNSNSPRQYSFEDGNLQSGNYCYRLKQIDRDGKFKYSQSVKSTVGIPRAIALGQNYPNPTNPSATISYSIPVRSHVTLSVFNALGQKVAELVNSDKDAGTYDVTFDASNLASGVYLYRMQAGSFVQTKKLVVMK